MGCLTPAIVNMFKVILMLVIFAIIVCFIGFLLDVLGTKSRLSLTVRSNGLLTIPIGIITGYIFNVNSFFYSNIFFSFNLCWSSESCILYNRSFGKGKSPFLFS